MALVLLLSLGLLLAPGLAAPATPVPKTVKKYSALVVFGDSLSDNGNGYAQTQWPSDPAYYKGRFSNGPVWAEHLAVTLSIPLHDYAHGGATTSNALVQGYTGPKGDIPVPSLTDQVGAYLAAPPADPAGSLFVLWGGINDVLFNPNVTAAQSVGVLSELMARLQRAGAADFVLNGLPDLAVIPYDAYVDGATQAVLRDFADHHYRQLGRAAQRVGAATGASVRVVDMMPLFRSFDVYEKGWRAAGFDQFGLYGSCLVGAYSEAPRRLCSDPDKHVFWDEYHPSGKTHALMANEVLKAL